MSPNQVFSATILCIGKIEGDPKGKPLQFDARGMDLKEEDFEVIDRRTFLLGSAAIGASVIAGGVLAGCSSQEKALPPDDSGQSANANTQDTSESTSQSTFGSTPVYFSRDISPEGLTRIWEALAFAPMGKVAVKLSTGEPGGHNFLQPSLIADLVQNTGASIVECNTAYGGARSTTESHMQAARDHGFTAIADVDIMDASGEMSIPVTGGRHLSEDIVGANLANYGSVISLAHFKGHAMGGFGGALKNCSIGIASANGKRYIHSAGTSKTSWGSPAQDDFIESMAEAAKAVSDHMGKDNMVYINVMNNLSVDCDCDSHPADPEIDDIGILASTDPVALDKACVDLVFATPGADALIERIDSRNGRHILEYAEEIGFGSQAYELREV